MKFTDYRHTIPKPILAKGARIANAGNVLEVSEEGTGVWRAEVQGEEIFVVRIETIDHGELECMCSCPNDEDDVCEHVAAVMLVLEGMMLEGAIGRGKKRKAPAKKKESKPEKLRRLLNRLPPEALLDLVLQMASEDTSLFNRLLLQVDDGSANAADYKRVIKDAFRAGRGSTGYVNTTGAKRVAAIVEGMLNQAEEGMRNGATARAATVVQTVISELNASIGQVDDKSGHLEAPYQRATVLVGVIARAAKDKDRVAIFNYLLEQGKSAALEVGNGWDLLTVAVEIADGLTERDRLDTHLAALERDYLRYRTWGDSAGYERCVQLRMALILRFDGPKQVRNFMDAHRQSHAVRMQLIKLHREENETGRALQLAEEGVAQYRKEANALLMKEYAALQISMLEAMGDAAGLIKVLQTHWMDTRRAEDFARFKAAIPADEWPKVREKLGVALKRDPQLAAWMWHEEGEWNQLLKVIRANPRWLTYHRLPLEEHFPGEMVTFYENLIEHQLKQPSYLVFDGEVLEVVKYLKHLIPEQKLQELIVRIQTKYPKRTALHKALRNL